ncbi:uncharacterized protein [Miscanthus floridulus]|uniref:uncharacterized protein n=1 Tax=Miscanthus floridulus TaxID=154761 RepID=UPI00345788E4
MPPPRSRAPPALPDELIEEVLLRVPPDDPASLVRAALACRRWCRLVANPAFRRRRLELHCARQPMLGFLCDGIWDGKSPSARFVPTSSFRPPHADLCGMRSLDARHGRVLFHSSVYRGYIVWNPITDQRVELPRPPLLGNRSIKATVLCAATGVCECDHLNCHSGPFIVVLVGTNDIAVGNGKVPNNMFSCIYSSESSAWSKPTYDDHPGDNFVSAHSALVGKTIFFALRSYERILKCDLGTQEMSVIRLPYVRTNTIFTDYVPIELTTLEDGRLGFARVEKSNELCLWSRGEGDDVEGWTLCKVIDLKDLFPLVDSCDLEHCLVGFAESVCVAFVAVHCGLFTIDMKSGLMKKVSEGPGICRAVPYINFCTPALEAPSRDDGQRVGISSGKGGCLKGLKS